MRTDLRAVVTYREQISTHFNLPLPAGRRRNMLVKSKKTTKLNEEQGVLCVKTGAADTYGDCLNT